MQPYSAHQLSHGNFKNNRTMKKTSFFAPVALGLMLVACAPKPAAEATETAEEGQPAAAAVVKTAKDYAPSKKQIDSVSYLVGINFGSFIKGYNFGDLNYNEIKKGINDFLNAKGNQRSPEFGEQFKINPEAMNELFNSFLENRRMQTSLENKEKGEKFLAANKSKSGVEVTPSGLQYKIVEAGSAVKPGPQDTVLVHYKGSLINGDVFDESPADADPIRLIMNRVIPGWTEGIQLIGEGGKIQLFVPSDLGYGQPGYRAKRDPHLRCRARISQAIR